MDQELIGFVAEPNCGRGTTGIIWNCVVTIILCTWTMIHNPKVGNRLKDKLLYVGFGLLVPEMTAAKSLMDFVYALRLRREIRKHGGPWATWSMKQSFLIMLEGLDANFKPFHLSGLIVRHRSVREAHGLFPTNDMIDGRSKSDTAAKIISTLQASWFVATVVFRLATHSPLSLIEVITVGYVGTGLIMGLSSMHMPKDITEKFQVTIQGMEIALETQSPMIPKPGALQASMTFMERKDKEMDRYHKIAYWVLNPLILLFTAIHLAAWNYHFPTVAEAVAWKVVTVLTGVLALWVNLRFLRLDMDTAGNYNVGLLALYFLGRLYLIGDSFAVLRASPAGIYTKPQWMSYMGHIGT